MTETLKPDMCVIGAGSGGLTAAAAARAFGASVVLIEKGSMGGDCLNVGCVPSKALIAAAAHAETAREAAAFGVFCDPPRIDFARVHQHIGEVIAGIAPHDSVERFEALGAKVIQAPASFADPRTVVAGGYRIKARRFIIATGSRPAVPALPGLATVPYLTNETIFALDRRPEHLLIVGAGPVGMELAQAWRRLGAAVTVLEKNAPLGHEDPELAAIVLARLRAEGVEIRAGARITSVARQGEGIAIAFDEGEQERMVTGSHLLIAAGRVPNTQGLGLEAAGIACDGMGIAVSPSRRTSNRRVYAIGDVGGGIHFTHAASYHASLAVRAALFGLPAREKRMHIPRVTFTDPQIAALGMSETEARAHHGDAIKVLRAAYAENDRARADRRTEGLVKLVADRRGHILGASVAGRGATEIIALIAYALANGNKVQSFATFIAPYPSLSELAKRIGVEFYKDMAGSPWLRYWLAFIRLLP